MKVRAGTSGYSYKEWKGNFYPADLPAAEMLPFYGKRFSTVEINNTFYRMPSDKMLANWCKQVPEGFAFVLKAPQRITHIKKLKEVGDDVAYLLKIMPALGCCRRLRGDGWRLGGADGEPRGPGPDRQKE